MPLVEGSTPSEERPMNDNPDVLRAAVERRFAQVARSPGQERKFPVGPASAKKLGYDPGEIDALPPSVTESFCGVGNPLALGELHPGQTVLDLGSGPGLTRYSTPRRAARISRSQAYLTPSPSRSISPC
jgi:arsenite methyltransferase